MPAGRGRPAEAAAELATATRLLARWESWRVAQLEQALVPLGLSPAGDAVACGVVR